MSRPEANLEEDNPFLRAGEDVPKIENVIQLEVRRNIEPHDRLRTNRFFGSPPLKSLYHTERAEAARQRAQAQVPDQLADASQTLIKAGLLRSNPDYADVADHNAMTLAYALRYQMCGLHVVDSHAIDPATGEGTGKQAGTTTAKTPRGAAWQDRASNNREEIVEFWTGDGEYPPNKEGEIYPYARVNAPRNVSITFPEGCGLFVLDIDGEEGKAALAALEAEHGVLPRTAKSVSGSGGWHFIFKGKRPIRNTASMIDTGVDIRGEGGQIIAAPSVHKSGNFYQWEVTPWDCIADAPEWLEELAFNATKSRQAKPKRESSNKSKSGRRSGADKTRVSETVGFDNILSEIGDHEGGGGFDSPIYRAACSWFATYGPDVDSSELFDALRDRIESAYRDPERDRFKYDTDEYLDRRIEQASEFIAEQRADAETEPFDMAAPLGDTLDEALTNLNRGFRYVNIGGEGRFLRVLLPGEKPKLEVWNTTALKNWYANRKVTVVTTDEDGNKHEEEINPVPMFFNRARRWSDTAFAPPPASVGQNTYNLFRGFTIQPDADGDCTMLKDFIKNIICDGDEEVYRWVWLWLAHMVQRPGEKPKTSLVYWGEGGTGKGTFGRLLRALVHPYGTTFGCHDDVVGRWAGQRHAMNIIGVSEEAVFSGNRSTVNQLKHKIDAEETTVEVKNIQPIEMPSYMRYAFDSNHPDAMAIEGNGSERRYCVMHVSSARKGDLEYFKALREQIDGDGLKALFHELMTFNPADAGMQWSDVFTAPETSDRSAMERETMRPVYREFSRMIDRGEFIHKDGADRFRFDLSEGQTRIPRSMLDAFVEKHGDVRQAAETEAERVFERLYGQPLPYKKRRCKCYYRNTQTHDVDEWELKDLNVSAYELPEYSTLIR